MRTLILFFNSNMDIPMYTGLLSFNASLLLHVAAKLLSIILFDI